MERNQINSFTQLRLLLALIVLFGHSFWILGASVTFQLGKIPVTFLAVYCFFAISGYLVAPKLEQNGIKSFLIRRSARIYPAYVGVIVVTGLIFSRIWQEQSPVENFGFKEQAKYMIYNLIPPPAIFSQGKYESNFLSGLPDGVILSHISNASLWTLTWEFLAYAVLASIYLVALSLKWPVNRCFKIVFFTVYVLSILWSINGFSYQFSDGSLIIAIFQKWPYFLSFFSGVFASTFVKAKNSPKRILLVSSILLICSVHSIFLFALFGAIALSHLVIILAQSNLLSGIKIKIDLSYGMYLYHFPVMQTIAHYAFCTNHIILSILIGLIISTLIAYISAKCLEQPMIRFAKSCS